MTESSLSLSFEVDNFSISCDRIFPDELCEMDSISVSYTQQKYSARLFVDSSAVSYKWDFKLAFL